MAFRHARLMRRCCAAVVAVLLCAAAFCFLDFHVPSAYAQDDSGSANSADTSVTESDKTDDQSDSSSHSSSDHPSNSSSDNPSSAANNHSSDDKSGTQSNAQSDHKPDHTDKDQSNGYAATNDINDAVTIHSYGATGETGATYKDNVVQYVSRVNPDAQNLSDGAKQLNYKSTLTYMFNPYYGSQRVDLVSGSLTVYYADRCTKTPMHNSDAFDWKCPANAVVPAQDYTYEYHADSVDTSTPYPQAQLMYNVITMHLPNRVALLVCYSYQGFSTKENGHGTWGGLTTHVRLDGYPMAENYISMHFEGLDLDPWKPGALPSTPVKHPVKQLPATGDAGVMPFVWGAVALLAIGLVCVWRIRRYRRQRVE